MHAPKPATTTNIVGPARRSDRVARDRERGDERADRRRSAQEPETGRPDLEDVLREDRQQRDRAAEEDGEEIERDRAEQHLRPPDETDAGENLVHPGSTFGRRLAAAAQGQHAAEREERQPGTDGIDELGPDREEDPAERGPDNVRAERRRTAARAR